MYKCLECGQSFKSISNTHLKKCSGLTIQEYCIKHNLEMSQLRYINPEKEKMYKPTPEDKSRENLSYLDIIEEQVLYGTMLGDSFFHSGNKLTNSTYMCMEHGIRQLDYMFWKMNKLERLGFVFKQTYEFSSVSKRMIAKNTANSRCFFLLSDYNKLFYNGSKKYISDCVLNNLSPLAISIWYMDNGTYNRDYCFFHTESFDKEENEKICLMFKNKYNINFKVLTKVDRPLYNEHCFLRTETRDDSKKFIELIEPYMYYKMLYKIGKDLGPKMEVTKSVVFDSAHYLEDHERKCKNLHGGRYELQITLRDNINPETGMVCDFTYLKQIVNNLIVDRLDHNFINSEVPELRWRSTTELMSIWMWHTLIQFLPSLEKIRLYETTDSFCEYKGPSLDDLKFSKDKQFLEQFTNLEIDNKIRKKVEWQRDEEYENNNTDYSVSYKEEEKINNKGFTLNEDKLIFEYNGFKMYCDKDKSEKEIEEAVSFIKKENKIKED